jgi:hypothetical protein
VPKTVTEIPEFICDGQCKHMNPYSLVLVQEFSAIVSASVVVFETESEIKFYPKLLEAVQIWRCGPEIEEDMKSGTNWKRVSFKKIQSNLYWDYESKKECDEYGNPNCGCFAESVETVDFVFFEPGRILLARTLHKTFDGMGEVRTYPKNTFA